MGDSFLFIFCVTTCRFFFNFVCVCVMIGGSAGILQFCKNTRQNVFISYVTFQRAFYQWTHMP